MSVSAPTYLYPPIDADQGQLYQGFVTFMQANIPGWVPYSGELDDWLARAFAGIQASLTEVASDVATSIYRYFGANIVNVPPLDATSAVGIVLITVQDANGPYVIPAFTQMSFPDASGTLQGFETNVDVTIPNGSTTASGVFVQAMTAGSSGNGCNGSGDLDSTGITFITGLTLQSATAGGTDAESDSAYLNRLTALFTTLTPTPVTPIDFTVIAASQVGVARAFTLPTFNPANWTTTGATHTTTTVDGIASTANIPLGAAFSGTGIPANTYVTGITSSTAITISNAATATASGVTFTIGGQLNQGGFVTSWVMGATDVLTTPQMTAIQATIQAECLANINYSVQAPTKNTVAVTAAVVAWPGVDTTATQTAVAAALTNFLEPQNFGQNNNPALTSGPPAQGWLNDTVVRVIVLENVIMNVPGVHYVSSLSINGVAADLPLQGIVPISEPGTMTVTVTNG